MARQQKVFYWCDVCLNDEVEEQVEATEVAVAVDKAKPKVIALCDDHRSTLLDPLMSLLDQFGQPVARVGGPNSIGPSPVSGNGRRRDHGTTASEAVLEENPDGIWKCPDCDKEIVLTSYKRPAQAIAQHRSKVHNLAAADH